MQLHPSVIMSISEHHSRTRAIRIQPDIVVGALLGKKSDHNIEIVDSFELRFTKSIQDTDCSSLLIDKEFFQKKLPLVKQVFAELDLIGWYSTLLMAESDAICARDLMLHRQISELMPNPIFLKLNPYRRESDPRINGSLPLKIYEPVIEIDAENEHLNLIEVTWTVVTEDVEIIGLEHNAKLTQVDELAPSASIDYLRLQYSAIKMLKDRIRLISKFVRDVQAGVLAYHQEPLAEIGKLSRRFPLVDSDQYSRAYNMQCNDVALNTYLGMLTKGSVSKLNFGKQTSKTRALPSTHARR